MYKIGHKNKSDLRFSLYSWIIWTDFMTDLECAGIPQTEQQAWAGKGGSAQ